MRRLLPTPAELDDDGLVDAYRLPEGPALRVNFVTSLDGSIAVDGKSAGLGSPGDKRVFRVLRALADVVLVGHGTAAAEGYRAVAPDSPVGRLRTSLGRPATVPIAVVSRRAALDPTSGLVTDAVSPTLLVTCAAADAGRRRALAEAGVEVLVCGDDDVDLPAAVAALTERGLAQVTCEGGPQLLHAALAAGIVDELDLTIAPALVGAPERLLDAVLPAPARLALRQLLEEDGVLFARYDVAPGAR
ncbi:dihydrofolate reductase family protein [Blastococcus sp. CCUG 61487]|uniref:dihydrofolate reductase family protein n=1 Tax=Blastococcus sp. CCUG 61487 TaxID=1840703 RepID=UPI0010C120D9|nr:dihydrofolate reductase family protein [Blastococcus sp. CCUG 61487]TKJ21696.1 deaminase [Blastococcus sp. CCUG 61487]